MPDDTKTPPDTTPETPTLEEPSKPPEADAVPVNVIKPAEPADAEPESAETKASTESGVASLPVPEPTPASEEEPSTATLKPITPQQPIVAPPPKSSKKKWLVIAGIIAAIIVVLGGAGVFAYNAWYQNPEKVVGDALSHLLSAKTVAYKGSFSAAITDQGRQAIPNVKSIGVEVEGKADGLQGELNATVTVTDMKGNTSLLLHGSGLFDKDGNLYLKLGGLADMLEQYKPDDKQLYGIMKDFVAKVDDKWIKLTADELKDVDQNTGDDAKCLQDSVKKYGQNGQLMELVGDTYRQHRFIDVTDTLPAQGGKAGYVVQINDAEQKAFTEALKGSDIYKELEKCGYHFDGSDTVSTDKQSNVRTELWIDQWSHQLAELKVDDGSSDSHTVVDFTTTFNQPADITVPAEAMSLNDLKQEIQKLQASYYYGADAGSASGSQPSVSI